MAMAAQSFETLLAQRIRAGHRARIEADREPTFINEQQRTFFDSKAPEVLYSGAFRAGKSRIGCEKAYSLAKRYPGIPIGIFRKVAADLEASTRFTLFHDVIPPEAIVRRNDTLRRYDLANGSIIRFFGLEPNPITGAPSKVGSVELGWAFIDEAYELSEADWAFVKGRLSWPGIPYHQLAAATNPAGPKHWLKRRFTPPTNDRVYLHASTFDNPALPADYVDQARSSDTDDVYHQRYYLGEWVAYEGQIYLLPDDQVREPEQTTWKRVVAGVDWGFVHAFACEVVAESGTGRRATIDEVYARGQLIEDLVPQLLKLQERYHIETFYADPSEPEYIAACKTKGVQIVPATNDVMPGIGAVKEAIAGGMTVSPRCTGLLDELPSYAWSRDRSTGQTREQPVKEADDAMDAWRYAVMGLGSEMGILGFYRAQIEARRATQAQAS
ncbi:MAG TPA: phage terminase large subunit [Candidatus Saccharimonadales bacterium]|nr:phage terminase large subunit [Candidatus Saccharimonadales bacterium]